MNGYAILATRDLFPTPRPPEGSRLRRALPALAGGALGAAVGGAHPVLGALLGGALVKNGMDLATGEATLPEAGRRLRSHAIATVGALAVPIAPMVGYCAGIIADNAVFGATWKPAPSYADVRAGSATLHEGMQGPAVETLQRTLNVDVDGKFGKETAAAVRAFKQVHPDMYSDDVVGKATLVAMDTAISRGESFARTPSPQAKPTPRTTTPSSMPPAVPAARDATSQEAPAAAPVENRFLAFLKQPVWKDSPVTVWHAGLLGLGLAGGIALLKAGIGDVSGGAVPA